MKNQTIIDAIIANASAEFKAAITVGSQTDFATYANAIVESGTLRNQFLASMMDKIVMVKVKAKRWDNPLAFLKKERMDYGRVIEEVFVDTIPEEQYDQASTTLLKSNPPSISSIYHVRNRQSKYPVSITKAQLKAAFFNEGGMMSLVNGILNSLYKSDAKDEYSYMKNIIQAYHTEGLFDVVTVTDPTTKETVEDFVIEVKAISNDMMFLKDDYNAAGVKNFCMKEDQILLIDPWYDARIDVSFLAQIFNMEIGEIEARKVIVDDFGGLDNVVAALVSKDWMEIHDTEFTVEDFRNGETLTTNYYLHHWGIYSASRFENAVLFTTTTPTVTGVTLLPATATVARKGSLQTTVTVAGTNNPPQKCSYTVDGTDSYVTPTGLLYVGANETTSPLTVTATSTFNTGFADTATITVS